MSVWPRFVQCFVSSSSALHVCSLLQLVDLVSFYQHLGLCPAGSVHVDIHGRCDWSNHFGCNQEDDTCLRLLIILEHRLIFCSFVGLDFLPGIAISLQNEGPLAITSDLWAEVDFRVAWVWFRAHPCRNSQLLYLMLGQCDSTTKSYFLAGFLKCLAGFLHCLGIRRLPFPEASWS